VIDASSLLSDLRRLLAELEDDLRERCGEVLELDARLRGE
jgi:hypothetical protein